MEISKPLHRLAILTNGGGPSIIAADLIGISAHLTLASFSPMTRSRLNKVLPPMAALGNPIDIIGDAPASRYEAALKIITADHNVDGVIAILTPQMMTEPVETAVVICRYSKLKPIIPVFMGGHTVAEGVNELARHNLINLCSGGL